MFGWLDTPAPGMTPALWSCVVGALVTLGLALGDRRSVVATILLVVLVLAVPVLMELTKYRESGFPWQGRYTLPLAVGVPIVAGVALAVSNRLPSPLARRLSLVALPFLGVANAVAYWGALHRYLFGASAGWSSAPAWNPPASPILLLAAGSVAIAVYVAWFWFLVEQSRRDQVWRVFWPGPRREVESSSTRCRQRPRAQPTNAVPCVEPQCPVAVNCEEVGITVTVTSSAPARLVKGYQSQPMRRAAFHPPEPLPEYSPSDQTAGRRP